MRDERRKEKRKKDKRKGSETKGERERRKEALVQSISFLLAKRLTQRSPVSSQHISKMRNTQFKSVKKESSS